MNASLKIGYVEWPAQLQPNSGQFKAIASSVHANGPDLLVTNEMPFGDWVWNSRKFRREMAAESIALHEAGIEALRALNLPTIVSSRPVWAGERVSNEAFALVNGGYVPLHHKHYFPEEFGWHESTWFRTKAAGFDVVQLPHIKVRVLLCTELMFNERARAYGRAGAELIVAPRATGQALNSWRTACSMAAIVSGCFVVSSNRKGSASTGVPTFGGGGMAFAPNGEQIGETGPGQELLSFDLDRKRVATQQALYPCYVNESADIMTGRLGRSV